MKTSKKLCAATLFGIASVMSWTPASAIHVDPEPEQPGQYSPIVLGEDGYERVEFVTENYTRIDAFTITEGGRYELTLTDMLFPGALRKLGAAVTTAEEKLVDLFGTGNILFDMQPGLYYLSVFAKPFTLDDPGLFGLTLQMTDGGATAVPTPAALWLFGSGLFAVAGVIRRRELR